MVNSNNIGQSNDEFDTDGRDGEIQNTETVQPTATDHKRFTFLSKIPFV